MRFGAMWVRCQRAAGALASAAMFPPRLPTGAVSVALGAWRTNRRQSRSTLTGVWRSGSASDSRSEGWEFEGTVYLSLSLPGAGSYQYGSVDMPRWVPRTLRRAGKSRE